MKHRFESWCADLYPGYFAFIMATGIISIACFQQGLMWVAELLVLISIVAYIVLWGLTLVRLARHFHRVVIDFTDHRRGPGFFTTVAGTCVLGMEIGVVRGRYEGAVILWCVGTVLWLVLMYTFFTAVTVRATKPSLEQGISGSWLNVVVATQSVSVLGTFVA
ncbi:MAG TPA: tellurite resistance/C4-dicarboxylate transporter family protein, partial [Verrucomicrobiae bacterium]|nr:tellurite resistance/C4-dicarboxylate transporter family protein [Verrucomicrobiae bacterium]